MMRIAWIALITISTSYAFANNEEITLHACRNEKVNALHLAKTLVRDDLQEFQRLEQCGMPREYKLDHVTAPFSAAKYDSAKILTHILDTWGVDINARDEWDESLFITALSAGSYSAARLLAERGAITESYDRFSRSVIDDARDPGFFLNRAEKEAWVLLRPHLEKISTDKQETAATDKQPQRHAYRGVPAPATPSTTYVAPDSELGKMMLQLDATGRFHQNKPTINSTIARFDNKCGKIDAEELLEPGERVSAKKYRYIISAKTERCGEQLYHSMITFKDAPRTLIKKIKIERKESFSDYEKFLADFLDSLREKDADKMVSMTSETTIRSSGRDNIKSHYVNDTIPALNACSSISTNGGAFYVPKAETGTGSGWGFRETCQYGDNKAVVLQFIVLRENGRLVMASIGASQ